MITTGDAIGSAYVWAHFGSITQYADSVRHLQDVLRPFDWVAVLPAHFYQIKQAARGKAPINGRPLDKAYVDDQRRVADGILNGTVVGEPYRVVGRHAAIATVDSAGVVYTLGNLGPADALDKAAYHAIVIPGPSVPTTPGGRYAAVDAIKSTLYLILTPVRSPCICRRLDESAAHRHRFYSWDRGIRQEACGQPPSRRDHHER